MNVYLTQQVREMDRQTIEKGIDRLILMENAAFAVTSVIVDIYGNTTRRRCSPLLQAAGSVSSTDSKHISRLVAPHGVWHAGSLSYALPQRKENFLHSKILSDAAIKGGVLVCAGTGNNGGDGLAAARQLAARGMAVSVILLGEEEEGRSPDWQRNIRMAKAAGVPVTPWSRLSDGAFMAQAAQAGLILDCLFGTGLSRPVTGRMKEWIQIINENAAAVLSVDVPSGIHSDSGQIMGAAVQADHTVTFEVMKPGLLLAHGRASSGQVLVLPIGIPEPVVSGMECKIKAITAADVPALLPPRQKRSQPLTSRLCFRPDKSVPIKGIMERYFACAEATPCPAR